MRKILVVLTLVTMLLSSCNKTQESSIISPDGAIKVDVLFRENGELFYTVLNNNHQVLKASKLGLIREDADFSSNLTYVSISNVEAVSDNYTLKVHKKAGYSYAANQRIITVANQNGEQMQVIFQVSDHGVAFRYKFIDSSNEVKKITREVSSFAFDTTARAWLQPCAHAKTSWGNCNPSYEEHYLQDIPVGTPSPLAGWVFPALFKTGDNWVLISETAIDRNYCASRLAPESSNGVYTIGFPEDKEVVFTGELNPQSKLPWETPWRIMAIGSLADVVESSLGTDLAKPAIAGDFSWVKPGRASWSWVLLKDNKTIYPVQKDFIDYASKMGWEYCLIDAGWDVQIGYDKIKELVDYAATKNVKIILWYNSSGDWNTAPQTPKSALLTHDDQVKELTRIKEMGVAGVKIDFFGGDGQSVMNHYLDLLQVTAEVGIEVNFHGCTLPRGWQRTYPQLVSMEAIKGMEYTTFDQKDMDPVANHCTVIPFTRNVFDPMDFTPTCFGEVDNIQRVTTNAFELALPVLFQSGVQHYAEIPEVMAEQPDYVQQLMKDIPVVWDDTRFIDGYPGKYVVIARKTGDTWYIGAINGQDSTQTVKVNLSFCNAKNGFLVTDGETNRSFKKEDLNLATDTLLTIAIVPRGGFVIKLN